MHFLRIQRGKGESLDGNLELITDPRVIPNVDDTQYSCGGKGHGLKKVLICHDDELVNERAEFAYYC